MEEELAKAFENSNYESTYSGGQMEGLFRESII